MTRLQFRIGQCWLRLLLVVLVACMVPSVALTRGVNAATTPGSGLPQQVTGLTVLDPSATPARVPMDAKSRALLARQAMQGSAALFRQDSIPYTVSLRAHLGALNAAYGRPDTDANTMAALQFPALQVISADQDLRYRLLLGQVVKATAAGAGQSGKTSKAPRKQGGPNFVLHGEVDMPGSSLTLPSPSGSLPWEKAGVAVAGALLAASHTGRPVDHLPTFSDNSVTAFPDVVAVTDPDHRYLCTGTLILPGVVLTARHCAQTFKVAEIGIGWDTLKGMQYVPVARPECMPADCNGQEGPDVMLLRTVGRAPTPVQDEALASSAMLQNAQPAMVVGFGQRQAGTAPTLPRGQRSASGIAIFSPACGGSDVKRFNCHSGVEFVAGPIVGSKEVNGDGCPGDSGGPVFIWMAGVRYLAGIVRGPLRDSQAGGCGAGGIYTRIDGPVTDWILRTASR